MTLNGEPFPLNEPVSLAEVLAAAGFALNKVAVLLNGKIVPKEKLAQTMAAEGDAVEVVSFVGGG